MPERVFICYQKWKQQLQSYIPSIFSIPQIHVLVFIHYEMYNKSASGASARNIELFYFVYVTFVVFLDENCTF